MMIAPSRLAIACVAAVSPVIATAPSALAQADPSTVGVGCSDSGFYVTSVTAQPGDVITLEGFGGGSATCTLDLGSTSITPTSFPTLAIVVPAGPAPADVLQQVPVPATGVCMGIDHAWFRYGTAVAGGSSRSWAAWANRGAGGDLCTRTLNYSTSLGTWAVG